jgi:hypothetical protein
MSNTKMHGPADSAPQTTGKYAVCQVCKAQWQVRVDTDKERCAFCGAAKHQIVVLAED